VTRGREAAGFFFSERREAVKTCPKMKTVIEELAQKHNIDLHEAGAHLRLDMPGYDRLCVENIGMNRISVAHYFELNGDLVAEPDVVFFVDSDGSWKPIEVSQSLFGWRQYVMFSPDGKRITLINRAAQRDLAEFAETWAQNISEQGWLAHGQLHIKTRRLAMEETKLLRKFVQELWVHKVQDARDVLRVQAPQGDELHVECTLDPFLVRLKYLVKEASGALVKDLEVTFFCDGSRILDSDRVPSPGRTSHLCAGSRAGTRACPAGSRQSECLRCLL
jgi:hypothetical protein